MTNLISELYIVLSDHCNFECGHCINSSGPRAKRWRADKNVIQYLARQINDNSSIHIVHFTGGEPTLVPDLLKSLQAKIVRPILYSVTTNGWLGQKIGKFLQEIHLDSIVLSYDKFHEEFIKLPTLVDFVHTARSLGVSVELNVVFEDLNEIIKTKPLVDAGAKLVLNPIILGGRAKNMTANISDSAAIDRTCPSLEGSHRDRPEKIIFYPGRGFSPCCGPLIFDYLGNDDFLYSSNFDTYETNSLRTCLKQGSLRNQAKQVGLDFGDLKFTSTCEACTMFYTPIQNELPPLKELAAQERPVEYYTASERLPKSHERMLNGKFHVKYLCTAVLKNQSTWIKNDISRPPMISTRSIGEVSQEDFAQFTLKTYYYRFTEHQDKFDVKQFLETVPRYFSENIFGRGYYKNGEMVGVIISHHYGQHPAINQSTLHIGYWGYDRSSVTPEEARWIKEDWFTSLAQWSSQLGDIPIDASIDWFNEPAFAMAFKRGFKQVCLRLDKRCLEK